MILPVLVYYYFQISPVYGLVIAFKDYNVFKALAQASGLAWKIREGVFQRSILEIHPQYCFIESVNTCCEFSTNHSRFVITERSQITKI